MKQKRISEEFEYSDSAYYPPSKKQRFDGKNAAAYKYKDGNIVRIYLQNFMTHQEFDWFPSARVNLITGVNGAGKSSILQAIVVGLGEYRLGALISPKKYLQLFKNFEELR